MRVVCPRGGVSSIIVVGSAVLLGPLAAAQNQTQSQSEESLEDLRLSEVVVESSAINQTLFDSSQPISVMNREDLQQRANGSLGETLAAEPGITASSFGAGSSRPVIRGLGGDRVRILQNGIGTQDVSNTSPDHATSTSSLLAQKIEVVRGPASLLYGTNAVGGIVNVFDSRIAEELPTSPVEGMVQMRANSVDRERSGAMSVTAPAGPFALHVDGFKTITDDYDIPGFVRTGDKRKESNIGEPKGRVPYSATDNDMIGLGSSYIFERGFFGASVSEFNTEYGVPNGERDVSIDGQQRRLDLRGSIRDVGDAFRSITFKMGGVDYEHTEFEGMEAGTTFKQHGFDARLECAHNKIGIAEGVVGVQIQHSNFEAVGEEAFQPPTQNRIYSGFVFEELPFSESFRIQLGGRGDATSVDSSGFGAMDAGSSFFLTLSESAGAVWNPSPEYAVALSVAHTERAPSSQELYANGPHVATTAFELGDQSLAPERSLGVDLNVRRDEGMVRGFAGVFYNHFWNYVNLSPTGQERDGLGVFAFRPVKADFMGFESQIKIIAVEESNREVSFDYQPDFVWARDSSNGEPLPRIPPLRMRFGANYYNQEIFKARVELQHVFEQDRTSQYETSTGGYSLLNAFISKEISLGNQTLDLYLRGSNLLNEKARNHVSFIKDIAPLPGASAMAGFTLNF